MREGAPWRYSRDIGITTDMWVSGTKWKHGQVDGMEGTRVRNGGIECDSSDGEISDGPHGRQKHVHHGHVFTKRKNMSATDMF